jgi:cytochrome c oxidase assembly protein subunit 15
MSAAVVLFQMKYNPALYWFAVLTAVMTFLLIGLGGLVTSHEAGMSVPDWPTSYGYNMFALPIKFWTGGALYEHTHRLYASFIGLLATILAVWLWLKDQRRWMGWLGVVAFVGAVIQGVLGGLRVVLHMDSLGIVHGAVAQAFFVLICAIALFTSKWWMTSASRQQIAVPRGLRSHVLYVTVLIFIQLLIGATMRHQHAGLAVNTFPLAYGKIWPDTSPEAIASYNEHRVEMNGENPITAFQVVLHMVHRIVALLVFLGVAAAAGLAVKKLGNRDGLTKFAWFWAGLLAVQVGLGIATVETNKAADIATLHVMAGALSLLTGALWWFVAARRTALTEIAVTGQNRLDEVRLGAMRTT